MVGQVSNIVGQAPVSPLPTPILIDIGTNDPTGMERYLRSLGWAVTNVEQVHGFSLQQTPQTWCFWLR
jgi:hypothetical protein